MKEEELEQSSGSMFHTNFCNLQRKYFCDDDCEQSGCKGHVMELRINNTAGVGCIVKDGNELLWLDCNEAQAIYDMMNDVLTCKI